MTRIAGASQFVNAAILANRTGVSAQPVSLLGGFDNSISLLETGKRINRSGIGLSASSRSLIRSFLSSTNGSFNALLSAGVAADTNALQTQILGLRSKLPASQISENAYKSQDVEKIGGRLDEEA